MTESTNETHQDRAFTFPTLNLPQCHFCSNHLSQSDQATLAHVAEQLELNQPVDDLFQWTVAGEVVPICELCRASVDEETDFPEFDAVDRWGMIFWRWMTGLIIAGSGAIIAGAITKSLQL